MINRLKQFNAFQEKIDILLAALCTYFQSLSINGEAALLPDFFQVPKNITNYLICNDIQNNLENIFFKIISGLLFFHKIYGIFYLNTITNEISLGYDNQQESLFLKDTSIKEEIIIWNFNDIGYYDNYFRQLIRELPNYSKEMSFDEKIEFHSRMLKLSQKIPFNAYTYCQDYITTTYFRYHELQFLEHKAKIVQYILDKLNEGIKNLIGSDEVKITGNFSVEAITKEKERLKNHN